MGTDVFGPTAQLAGVWAGAGFAAAYVVIVILGFAQGGRKTIADATVRVRAGGLLGGAFVTFARHPGALILLTIVGTAGSAASSFVGYLSGTFSSPANFVWLIVNSIMLFFWHRSVLKPDAEAAGFDFARGNLVAVIGRGLLVGILVVVVLFLAIAVAASALFIRTPPDAAVIAVGVIAGVAAALIIVWNSRFVLTFPATSIGQPAPGVFDMHARARGLGTALTAALSVALLLMFVAVIGLGFVSNMIYARIDPVGYIAFLQDDVSDVLMNPQFRPIEFLLYDVPAGLAASVYTLLSISIVSITYRRWIIPEYAAARADDALGAERPV